MKDNERTIEINVEVTTNHYDKNGELTDAIAAGAKLTKADAGRTAYVDNDSLTIKIDSTETSKAEVDYNGSSTSTGDDVSITKTVEVNVKGQVMDMTKGELIDAIAAGSKLTKADAGRMANETAEDWFNLQMEDNGDGSKPEVTTAAIRSLPKLMQVKQTLTLKN